MTDFMELAKQFDIIFVFAACIGGTVGLVGCAISDVLIAIIDHVKTRRRKRKEASETDAKDKETE